MSEDEYFDVLEAKKRERYLRLAADGLYAQKHPEYVEPEDVDRPQEPQTSQESPLVVFVQSDEASLREQHMEEDRRERDELYRRPSQERDELYRRPSQGYNPQKTKPKPQKASSGKPRGHDSWIAWIMR